MTIHLVQFSTGITSAEVAYRVVAEHGRENTILLTANTLVEDWDNWRFANEVVAQLNCSWITLADGRTPMQVGKDRRNVPSNFMPVCSEELKRRLLRKYIDAHYDPADTIVYLGFDWEEDRRYNKSVPLWQPYTIDCPLMRRPFIDKIALLDKFRDERGIEPPRLYAMGWNHANCGGACVRGGQAQWELLHRLMPDRYRQWENGENELRADLGKDHAMMTEKVRGVKRPLPLTVLRERLESQPDLFDENDWGACGCTEFPVELDA
jgi:hypothetical protein